MADTQQHLTDAPKGEKILPAYETPTVVTYTDEEILEELGPARAGQNPGDGVFDL
jgi:hypothetical protein